ncbi:hypothetical protein [Nostoc sp. NZL]|uniref:hypothetical protein n=1 Tax=Nostoc sp. NZL TaxID=2650612 RepID=UPI0018C7458A|nr:hypothetical protein [Nostoc sp. NZL]
MTNISDVYDGLRLRADFDSPWKEIIEAYSTLQLNEVQNQGFTNQIILLPPADARRLATATLSCLKTSDFVPHVKENCCIFPKQCIYFSRNFRIN